MPPTPRPIIDVSTMLSSLKIAVRTLLSAPGFAVISIVTLALGVGVNTAIFSIVDSILFRAAPFPDSDRLVQIFDVTAQFNDGRFSVQDLDELRQHSPNFSSVTSFTIWQYSLAEPNQPAEKLQSVCASKEFFDTFRVQPMLGRGFTPDEEVPGRNNVAILSYDLWQKRFGGQSNIVGKTIRLSTEPVTVIGVMPASLHFPMLWGRVDLWRPVSLPRYLVEPREKRFFSCVARLKSGVTPAQAEAQLAPLAERLAKDHPELNKGHSFHVLPLHEAVVDSTSRSFTWLLFGLSSFVLLIACANLANLQVARAITYARDFAIRSALGASRGRLIRQQLLQCMVLSVAGGAIGLLVASWLMELLERNLLIQNEPLTTLSFDPLVLTMTIAVSLLTGVGFGILPAWLGSRVDANNALKQQGRGSTSGRGAARIRQSLIVIEIVMAVALLAGANVMLRGFNRYFDSNHGWDTEHLLTATIHLPEETRYNTDDARRQLHKKLEQRLAAIPGVEKAALSNSLPIGFYQTVLPFEIAGQTSTVKNEQPVAGFTLVSTDYFSALGISLVEGRLFAADHTAASPPVVVINESLAHHFWPNESAIGKRLASGDGGQHAWREVIGVVRDVSFAGNVVFSFTPYQVYRPLVEEPWGYLNIALKSQSPLSLKNELNRAMVDVDADIAVEDVYTVREAVAAFQRNLMLVRNIMEIFALLGLALAAIGLYGVISQLVAQRTSEFGIRLALGAQRIDVLSLVIKTGLRLTLVGGAIGLIGGYGVSRLLISLMPRLEGTIDFVGIFLTAGILVLVSLVAILLPALRATRVDPVTALRAD